MFLLRHSVVTSERNSLTLEVMLLHQLRIMAAVRRMWMCVCPLRLKLLVANLTFWSLGQVLWCSRTHGLDMVMMSDIKSGVSQPTLKLAKRSLSLPNRCISIFGMPSSIGHGRLAADGFSSTQPLHL